MRLMLGAVCAAALVFAAHAQETELGPGFDCERATSKTEKAICDMPGTSVAFMDRQLNKIVDLLGAAADAKGKQKLQDAQRSFIKTRDKCGDNFECLDKAYRTRLDELAGNPGPGGAVGFFRGETGELILAIYPDATVAISALTVGGGGHSCAYENDDGMEMPDGNYMWQTAVNMGGPESAICTVTVSPAGASMTLATGGDGCSYYCGMRAVLDGEFSRTVP
jgi:uncharacterized protein